MIAAGGNLLADGRAAFVRAFGELDITVLREELAATLARLETTTVAATTAATTATTATGTGGGTAMDTTTTPLTPMQLAARFLGRPLEN